jgi:membrane-anchored protein YejM (alkaline phosphatase superfamily)
LWGLIGVGEGQVTKTALKKIESSWNILVGLQKEGYQTVGTGAMTWFLQESLTAGFEKFLFTGTDADRQISFLIEKIDIKLPFFGFINFGETHAPYTYRGKKEPCKDDVRARRMIWPSIEQGPVGRETDAFKSQVAAAEFLDSCLPPLFNALPGNTIVVLTSDHGDCFGEDGYWGHAVNHPKVFEVFLAIFRLDRRLLDR